MAKKKEATEAPAEGVLVQAAKTLGDAAGKIATAVGVGGGVGVPKPAKPKAQKLPKKNKSRLPRKEKKAARKAMKST
jgi:hypothetical protein